MKGHPKITPPDNSVATNLLYVVGILFIMSPWIIGALAVLGLVS